MELAPVEGLGPAPVSRGWYSERAPGTSHPPPLRPTFHRFQMGPTVTRTRYRRPPLLLPLVLGVGVGFLPTLPAVAFADGATTVAGPGDRLTVPSDVTTRGWTGGLLQPGTQVLVNGVFQTVPSDPVELAKFRDSLLSNNNV